MTGAPGWPVPLWHAWRRAFRARSPQLVVHEGARLEEIADLPVLAEAWSRVRANKGGPGGDGITLEQIAPAIERHLAELSEALLAETYRPLALRIAPIRKESGGKRFLAIPAIIDRIAQTAALIALDSGIDARMSETSWAYRHGRGVPEAVAAVGTAFAAGHGWTVDADIKSYFDRIPHRHLRADLSIWIDDPRIMRLMDKWLASFSRRGYGIAQGAPISPLLANIYLHPLDRLLTAAGYAIVRYADDFVILAGDEMRAEKALALAEQILRERGLRLNRAKTRIVPPETEFVFLGRKLCAARIRGKLPAVASTR
jgi:group II intron reverse transcriptase/maturase